MLDRFKFRLFNKAVKEFIYFDNAELSIDKENMGLLFRSDHLYLGNYEELQQCTGLKDKNDKLIYEGDIIKIPDDWDEYGMMAGEKREIYFNEGGFRLKPKWDKNSRGNWLEDTKDFEVIGNIYENPELLEVQKCL